VYGEDGSRLFDFRAEGLLGFKVEGDILEPIGIELPWPVPRVHAAKNIGDSDYYEILFELKEGQVTRKYVEAMHERFLQGEIGGTAAQVAENQVSSASPAATSALTVLVWSMGALGAHLYFRYYDELVQYDRRA